MKRFFVMILTLCMLLVLCACDGSSKNAQQETTAPIEEEIVAESGWTDSMDFAS